jgi:hypothetical protein
MKGTREQPIAVSNYGDGPLPVIDGGQTSTERGRDYCIDAINTTYKWITIDGIECRNAYKQGITFQAYSGTGDSGLGVVVQNSYIHHTGAGACSSCGPTPSPDPGGYLNQLDAQFTTQVKFLNNTLDHLGGHNAINIHYDTGGPIVSGNVVGTLTPYCNHNCVDLKGVVAAQVTNNVITCSHCAPSTAAFYTENTGYRSVRASDVNYIGNVVYDVPLAFQAETGGTCLAMPCAITIRVYNNTIILPHSDSFNLIDTSCTAHRWDVQKNMIDGGTTDIHRDCQLRWDYNLDGGIFTVTGNAVGQHDLTRLNPQYLHMFGSKFYPRNSLLLNYGAADSVTPFPYLGAGALTANSAK